MERIEEKFQIFAGGTGGIDSWIASSRQPTILKTLGEVISTPLTRARFNQLLTLAHEAPISDAMFKYYWLSVPQDHPYDVTSLPEYQSQYAVLQSISSIGQLFWGMYRFYVDALLYFGSIRTAFQKLRTLSDCELHEFFVRHSFSKDGLIARGPALDLNEIAKDNRYLISEMACKSFEAPLTGEAELPGALRSAYEHFVRNGGGPVSFRQLIEGDFTKNSYGDRQLQLQFAADDLLEERVQSLEELEDKLARVTKKYQEARQAALANTAKYLSMVGDLDVYVATSMRNRADFRSMADFCEKIFGASELQELNMRYFDPTMSAASHHEDKGLIECLMVKCAKALVLYAGARDSFGKDAEAAMALSLGKPVIIFCAEAERQRFFRDVHPLSRLIDFETGVAVGAMVTASEGDVSKLLHRILTNRMQYILEQRTPGYIILKERITDSVVRLQTNDSLLRETFWNHYHNSLR